jgi:DNA-binding transcriptional LysR family regulator
MSSPSLTEASRKLNVSQPAVSAMLKQMESQLGLTLFERVGGRLHPTPQAEILFADVDAIFTRVTNVRKLATNLREIKPDTLSIMAPPALTFALLPAAIKRFHHLRPGLTVQLHSLPSPLIPEKVVRGEADLGIIYGETKFPGAEVIRSGQSQVACVMHPKHPVAKLDSVAPPDLIEHDIVSYQKSMPVGILIHRWFQDCGLTPAVRIEISSSVAACFIVNEENAVALLVDNLVLSSGAFPQLVRKSLSPPIQIEFGFVLRAGRPRSRLVVDFMNIVQELVNDVR